MNRGARARRCMAVILPGALLLGLASCAYYNTFYLAKKDFRAAEESVAKSGTDKLPSDAKANYDIAIRQSKKVIVLHSKSRWVDDAIYLMGASYFGKGEYDSSLASIGLLLSRFPKTHFRPDALFLTGMCYTKQHEYEQASAFLDSVLVRYPKYEKLDQVLFTLGESAATRRDRNRAIRWYEQVARDYPKSRYTIPAMRRVGELYFEASRYDSASIAYGAMLSASKESKDRIEAGVLQAQTLVRLGKAEEALTLLRDLEPPEAVAPTATPEPASSSTSGDHTGEGQTSTTPPVTPPPAAAQTVSADVGDQIARLRLGEAAALSKLQQNEEALRLLRDVVQRFNQSNYAVEAQFQIGYTYETLMDSLEAARSAYDKAGQLTGRSVFKDQAAARSKALQAQIELEKKAGEGDAQAEQRAAAALRVAEILLLDRELVDAAVARYQAVEKEYPDSRSAPRAAYALAYVRWTKQGDSLGAQEQFRDLVKRYPSSLAARGAIAILAAQRADTAGLAGLLSAVVPESTATLPEGSPSLSDSTSSPADTTSMPGLTPGMGSLQGSSEGKVGAPRDSARVRDESDRLPRKGSRSSSSRSGPPEEEGPPAPQGGTDGQLPAPPSEQPKAVPRAATPPRSPEEEGPPAPQGGTDGQLPAPPSEQPKAVPRAATPPRSPEQEGPPAPQGGTDGQLPAPPSEQPKAVPRAATPPRSPEEEGPPAPQGGTDGQLPAPPSEQPKAVPRAATPPRSPEQEGPPAPQGGTDGQLPAPPSEQPKAVPRAATPPRSPEQEGPPAPQGGTDGQLPAPPSTQPKIKP